MSLVNLAQVKGTETLKNDVQKMLTSYDALKQTCEANKAYVDKKIADLVNGAPEQLDTLQELSKALNNDKDYAATVNNALAEKLGRTEKAASAETADYAKAADSANTLEGVPLSHGGDSVLGKIPTVGEDGVLEIGKYIDFHSKNGDKKDYSTRITANDNGTISISGGINANLNGNASSASSVPWTGVTGKPSTYPPSGHNHDSAYPATNGSRATGTWGINITGKANTAGTADNATKADTLTGFTRNDDHTWGSETGELVANFYLGDGAEIAFKKNNPSAGKTAMLIDGVVYQNEGLYKCIDENSINDYLAGAGIVSQQLSQDASYIKYANGLLVQFGTMQVQGYAGTKSYIKTLPVSFKEVYSMQATLGYPSAREVSSVQIESDLTYVKLWIYNFVSSSDSVTTFYGHWLMIGTWK